MMLAISVYLMGKIEKLGYVMILTTFLVMSFYVNLKFRIVLKYPYEGNLNFNENLGYSLVILGKFAYIINLIVIANPDKNLNHDFIMYCLVIFMFHLFIFKDTSYIYNNNLIYKFSKVIDIQDIVTYEVRDKSFDNYYLFIYLKNDDVLKLKLSDYNYQKLQNFQLEIG